MVNNLGSERGSADTGDAGIKKYIQKLKKQRKWKKQEEKHLEKKI